MRWMSLLNRAAISRRMASLTFVTKLRLGHAYPRSSASSSDAGLPPSMPERDPEGKSGYGLRDRVGWHADEAELRGYAVPSGSLGPSGAPGVSLVVIPFRHLRDQIVIHPGGDLHRDHLADFDPLAADEHRAIDLRSIRENAAHE